MNIQRFTGSISFLPGRIFVHNQGLQPITTTTGKAILNGKEFIISIDPVNLQAAGVLRLFTQDAIKFTGDFTYAGKDQPEAKADLEYFDNEKSAILIGEWIEDTHIYTCFIQLNRIGAFLDAAENESGLRFI